MCRVIQRSWSIMHERSWIADPRRFSDAGGLDEVGGRTAWVSSAGSWKERSTSLNR